MPVQKKRGKKKSGATRNTGQKSSGLSWMIMGLLVGLFVAFLVYLDKIPSQQSEQNSISAQDQNKTTKDNKSGTNAQQKSQPKEHQFDFYTVLPDREVESIAIEEVAVKKQESKTSPITGAASAKSDDKKPANQSMALYQLQVGAFKELNKADAMKARLAFLGVESNIQVIHNNGQKMYRVRVGPSTDSQKINQIKAQLKSQNINTFVQKL